MTQLHHSTSADESVFYQLMRKYGENIYQQASRDRLTICIPPDDDVRQVGLMYASSTAKIQSFIKSHLLRNSPFFVGQYISEMNKTVGEIENKRSLLSRASSLNFLKRDNSNSEDEKPAVKLLETGDGFQLKFKVKVLHEETCYNDDFQPFSMWLIDKCLVEDHEKIRSEAISKFSHGKITMEKQKEPIAEEEFHDFIIQTSSELYEACMNRIHYFHKSVQLLKGFHQEVAELLRKFYNQLINEVGQDDPRFQNSQWAVSMKNSLMNVVVSGVYDKLFPFWTNSHSDDDRLLLAQQRAVSVLSFEALEIPKPFQAPQKAAISLIQTLNNRRSAFDKMKCIKETSDLILSTVNEYQQSLKDSSNEVLTSDELVPLMTYVLSRAKLPNLASNLTFMHEFSIEEISSTEYGFALTSLEVAIGFLKKQASNLGVTEIPRDEQPEEVESHKPMASPRMRNEAARALRLTKGMSLSAIKESPRAKSPNQKNVDRKSMSFSIISQFEKRLPDYKPPPPTQPDKKKEELMQSAATSDHPLSLSSPLKSIDLNEPKGSLGSFVQSLLDDDE